MSNSRRMMRTSLRSAQRLRRAESFDFVTPKKPVNEESFLTNDSTKVLPSVSCSRDQQEANN